MLHLIINHHLLQTSNGSAWHWGCQVGEVSVLEVWQVWKINFHLLEHDTGTVFCVGEWEHLSFHSHFCVLHLLRQVHIWKHHLGWSQSDWIIFLLICFLDAGQNCCRRRLCKPMQWHYWGFEDWGLHCSAATAVFHMENSLANGQYVSSIHNEECSWGKLNYRMILCTSPLRFIFRVESNSMNVFKWCMMDPFRISATCLLICWCMPYACTSSKLKGLLCLNGVCMKELLSFKANPSNCLGMLPLVQT